MLTLVAYVFNLVLVATGIFQYLRLELCWAGLGVGIGVMNLIVLYFPNAFNIAAILAALGSVIAVAQGTILGTQAVNVFAQKGLPTGDASMWDLIFSGHDFSYSLAYVGAGLSTLIFLAQKRRERASKHG